MRSRPGRTLLLIIGLLAWAGVGTRAQLPIVQAVSPFDIIGFIDAATVTDPNDVLSGGTLTVDGTVITIPRNTLLQMPAFALTWQEVFAMAPAPYAPTQTGIAQADLPTPAVTYEVHVQGNRVLAGGTDQYIAGLVFLSQQSLNASAGFINFIDYATGEMRVGGIIGDRTTGARVRINDPIGRHGLATDGSITAVPKLDARFQQDEDNPTVRSETGYPMCVPRSDPATADDPLCPRVNRPKGTDGNYLTIFTMDPPNFGQVPPPVTNPNLMAPFVVGDYIDYNGNLVTDVTGTYIAAWGVIANVGLFTTPGYQPVYTAIDVMLLGTGGIPIPLLPQEAAVRTRMEGFTTDPTQAVDLFAVDVDACSGLSTWRYYATIGVDQGPPNGAVKGRWRWRPSREAPFLPPTRMLLAVSEGGIVDTPTPNGIFAGMYIAPNFDFIFPENLRIGNPKVPANLQDFPFLADGSGPYTSVANPAVTVKLGQLSPWPGAVAPIAPICDPATGTAVHAPIADAGVHQSVAPGTLVTLNAAASRDTNVPPRVLTFSWQQTGGQIVTVTGANTATPTFTTPLTDLLGNPITSQLLEFTVTVGNGSTLFSSARVTVTNAQPVVPTDTVTITSAVFRIRRSQLLVNASTSNATAVLTVVGFGEMGAAPPLAFGVPAPLTDRQYRQVGVNPQPTTVTVISSLGGSATLPVTVK